MRKIILHLIVSLLPILAFAAEPAGTIAKIWSFPVVYNYDEEVTWYFDLQGTTFTPEEDVYLWIWSPSEPDAGNWENSSDFTRLTHVGSMVWKITLTPTLFFNRTADAIAASAGFWFRLKTKTGTKESDVASIPQVYGLPGTIVNDFIAADSLIKSFPSAPLVNQPISILFNSNLIEAFEGATSIHMHAGLNNWAIEQLYQAHLPEIVEKTRLKHMGDGIYRMDLIPNVYFPNVPVDFVFENLVFLFVKDNWAATTPDQVILADEFIPPPPPTLTLFPLRISQRDIMMIIRSDNESGVNMLRYTVTAGSKAFSGEISGTTAQIKGFINLVTELQGIEGLTNIRLVLRDNNDRLILDSNIPLVKLD